MAELTDYVVDAHLASVELLIEEFSRRCGRRLLIYDSPNVPPFPPVTLPIEIDTSLGPQFTWQLVEFRLGSFLTNNNLKDLYRHIREDDVVRLTTWLNQLSLLDVAIIVPMLTKFMHNLVEMQLSDEARLKNEAEEHEIEELEALQLGELDNLLTHVLSDLRRQEVEVKELELKAVQCGNEKHESEIAEVDKAKDCQGKDPEGKVDEATDSEAIKDEATDSQAIGDEAAGSKAMKDEAEGNLAKDPQAEDLEGKEDGAPKAIKDEAADSQAIEDEAIEDEALGPEAEDDGGYLCLELYERIFRSIAGTTDRYPDEPHESQSYPITHFLKRVPTLKEVRDHLMTLFEDNQLPAGLIDYVNLVKLTAAVGSAPDPGAKQALIDWNFMEAAGCEILLYFQKSLCTALDITARYLIQDRVYTPRVLNALNAPEHKLCIIKLYF